jgi:hypothetical protein
MKFPKGQSGNPGGRPKVLGEVQELARQHAPSAIAELARLALKAKNETARIAAIRELLDRGYGRPRQAVEVSAPVGDPLDPLRVLMQEIDAIERKRTYKQTFEEISRS